MSTKERIVYFKTKKGLLMRSLLEGRMIRVDIETQQVSAPISIDGLYDDKKDTEEDMS